MKSKILFGIAFAAVIVAVGWQRNAISQIRAANESLRQETPAPPLVANDPVSAATEEIEALQNANRELPKLRNEVRKLREEKRELEKLQTENQRLAASLKAAPKTGAPSLSEAEGFVLKQTWSNAGFATPEATVQTFFWAIAQRDAKRIAECMPDNDRQKIERGLRGDESFSDLAKMQGFRIVEKKQIAEDKVELGIQAAAGGRVMPMPVRLVNGEWKLSD